MDKTSEKVTKDPNGVKGARKGREKYMNKLKKSILTMQKKVTEILPMQAMKIPMQAMKLPMQTMKLPAQDQMTLMSMGLVCLGSLPSVLVYFLHVTLPRLKTKNRINYQNDVICFGKIYNK